jgi:hypothetical protein
MKQRTDLWQMGTLFHVTNRYPRKPNVPRVDRLSGILKRGLIAPACCPEGLVSSDLNITVTGVSVPYDSLVFLHQFGEPSFLYTMCERDRFTIFVDPVFPVLTWDDMGPHWPVLSQDEVYVRERVPPENLTGVAIHLYDYQGNILWSPA